MPLSHDLFLLTQGAEPYILASQKGPLLSIVSDTRLDAFIEAAEFFAPKRQILPFPHWDVLPFDRTSPSKDVLATRLATLTHLSSKADNNVWVVTTVSAFLQRVPPPSLFKESVRSFSVGENLSLHEAQTFLVKQGYIRTDITRDQGEFAVRGDILDVFPFGADNPLRMDIFGNQIEKIRAFDALEQRTLHPVQNFQILPANEFLFSPVQLNHFKQSYKEAFGADAYKDPFYEGISAGRVMMGMEHFLPLFYPKLSHLTDYLPAKTLIQCPELVKPALESNVHIIQDYYEARRGIAGMKALPPSQLYLTHHEALEILERHDTLYTHPFDRDGKIDRADTKKSPAFAAERGTEGHFFKDVTDFIKEEKKPVLIAAYTEGSLDRLSHLLGENGFENTPRIKNFDAFSKKNPVTLTLAGIDEGFITKDLIVLSENDLFGEKLIGTPKRRRRSDLIIEDLSILTLGDLVVHNDHGIGRYDGLEQLSVHGGAAHDCIRLIYAGGDKLFVPVENMEVLSRFGSEEGGVALDKLGGAAWQMRKAKAKEHILAMAEGLLKIAAARKLHPAAVYPIQSGTYDEFASRFPYAETEDQQRAIDEVAADLVSGIPMDRLVCGDVGFGKTEVALRAAFIAAMSGAQVAVIAPTTLLVRQHYHEFKRRFAGFPIRVEQLSRLVSARHMKETKEGAAAGSVGVVIGTHALLAKSMKFKNLGLMIIDEEQHFGVVQKERLKELQAEVHVLTMTATPIPRTMQQALSGVKDLSIIATAPVSRLPIRTFILPYDSGVIHDALMREYHRGGQSFYVVPRIEDLAGLAERLQKLVPQLKIAVAHGAMAASIVEKVMMQFTDRQYDILLSTQIIESGLDIPSANTMIIHRADQFGLAQLYQLRGRVGRSKIQSYAYLTYDAQKQLTENAQKRLEVMQTLDSLGAGFKLASYDLDIRGAGNLLGKEQSGHIRDVGVVLYQHMLEEAIANHQGDTIALEALKDEAWVPQINLGLAVMIPENYIKDLSVRMSLYQRLSPMRSEKDVESFAAELIDRFGAFPSEVDNLLETVKLKIACRHANIDKLDAGPSGFVLSFKDNKFNNPDGLLGYIAQNAGTVKLRPDHKIVVTRSLKDSADMMREGRKVAKMLEEINLRK